MIIAVMNRPKMRGGRRMVVHGHAQDQRRARTGHCGGVIAQAFVRGPAHQGLGFPLAAQDSSPWSGDNSSARRTVQRSHFRSRLRRYFLIECFAR